MHFSGNSIAATSTSVYHSNQLSYLSKEISPVAVIAFWIALPKPCCPSPQLEWLLKVGVAAVGIVVGFMVPEKIIASEGCGTLK